MESMGYKEESCKNYWQQYKEGNVKHKSVQSVFSDKDGYQFEVQFHTPSSQQAKDKKVPIYEERRKLGNTPDRNAELEKQRAAFEEAHKDDPKPPKFREPEFKRDCLTMHFYIPEELKYKAEVKFDKEGANWGVVFIVAVVSIILCMALCYILPDVLKYVDNFITIVKEF